MDDMRQYLAGHRFFAGMSAKHIDLLAGCARGVRFSKGQYLCHEGEPANHFYLIQEGRVAIAAHTSPLGEVGLLTQAAGQVVGADWLFPPYRRSFDYRALEPTLVQEMDGRCLRGECEQDHELGYQLMLRFSGALAQLLKATRLQLLEVIHEHAVE